MDSDSEEDIDDVVIPVDPGKWSQADTGLVGSRLPPFVKKDMSIIDRELLEGLSTPLEYYKLFQPNSFVEEVTNDISAYNA